MPSKGSESVCDIDRHFQGRPFGISLFCSNLKKKRLDITTINYGVHIRVKKEADDLKYQQCS